MQKEEITGSGGQIGDAKSLGQLRLPYLLEAVTKRIEAAKELLEGRAVFRAIGSRIIGNVEVGGGANFWPNCILETRDGGGIIVGAGTSVQDCCWITAKGGRVKIGSLVDIGHRAKIMGESIEVGDGALIGMGAEIGSRVRLGVGAVVAAGEVVPDGTVIGDGMTWVNGKANLREKLIDLGYRSATYYLENTVPAMETGDIDVRELPGNTYLIGDVRTGGEVVFGDRVVVRGDHNLIDIGNNVSIGGETVIHVRPDELWGDIGDYKVRIRSGTKIGSRCIVHSAEEINEDTVIGDDCIIIDGVKIGKKVKIGDKVVIYSKANIGEGTVIGDNTSIYRDADIGKNVKIGRNVTILPQAKVPDGTVIEDEVTVKPGK